MANAERAYEIPVPPDCPVCREPVHAYETTRRGFDILAPCGHQIRRPVRYNLTLGRDRGPHEH